MEKNNKTVLSHIWSFFISVKLTVVILLCLAATSIIGTVIVQNQSPAFYFKVYGPVLYNLFDLLDIFDMYHSWWFRMLMAGLFINIVACSIHRLSAGWKAIFPKKPVLHPDRIKSAAEPVAFRSEKSVDELKNRLMPLFAKQVGFFQMRAIPNGEMLIGEKNRWTRLGVYIVHLSVIFLILGGLIGSYLGFEGFVNIPEGEQTNRIQLRNTNQTLTLPFVIACERFEVHFYPNGAPREYKSFLTVMEDNREVLKKEIIVNDPLRYKGISIYQSSYGQMPDPTPPAAADLASKPIVLHYTAAESGMQYTKTLRIGESFNLPEGQGTFLLKEHRSADTFGGQTIGDTLIGVLSPPGQPSMEIQLPLRYESFDRMRRGFFAFTIGNAHELLGHSDNEPKRYYTGLQVSKDPGVWVVYLGFIFMIAGCYISFFMSHQQMVLEIVSEKNHSRVILSGMANKNRTGMTLTLKKLSESFMKKLSADEKDNL